MLATVEITPWHWAGFFLLIAIFLALDLLAFLDRHPPDGLPVLSALLWTLIWFALAMLFAAALRPVSGEKSALAFLAAYVIEFSLSLDNLFVIGLIFAWFGVPRQHRYRVLLWGVVGAVVMRGMMIGAGIALVSWVHWIFYGFGILLVFSGTKMLFAKAELKPEKNLALKLARKLFPVSPEMDGGKFVTRWEGRTALTPLALVLVMVETSDLLFAGDSIPAVFSVTTDPFVVFTSNILAVLGLRSLYFVLEGALAYFRYLKYGLSLVLIFVGMKMLLDPHGRPPKRFQAQVPVPATLLTVGVILLVSIALSVAMSSREKRRGTEP